MMYREAPKSDRDRLMEEYLDSNFKYLQEFLFNKVKELEEDLKVAKLTIYEMKEEDSMYKDEHFGEYGYEKR